MSGTKFRQKEIALVPFAYSDLSSSNARPVLIVSNDDDNAHFQDTLVCVINSNLRSDEYSIRLENEDLDLGILPESSMVKAHKLFTSDQTKVIKKFSVVKDDYFNKVADKVRRLIASSK